jgi:hypothetical protein
MEFWIKDPFCDQAIACCDIQNNVGFSGNGRDHDPATNVTHDNILKIDPQYRDDINTKIRIKTRDCSASPTSRFNRPVVHDNLQKNLTLTMALTQFSSLLYYCTDRILQYEDHLLRFMRG